MTEPKLPPNNLDAERSVIGCLAFDGSKLDEIADILKPSDFYTDIHATIYRNCIELRQGGSEIDVVTLASQLESKGQLADVGGPAFLLEIMSTVPHSAHIQHYARLVLDCSRRRQAMIVGRQLSEKAADMTAGSDELIDATLTSVMKLNQLLTANKRGPRTISEHVSAVIETYGQGATPTVWWGIDEIDQMIGGVMPGELVIIGARPSHGKSLLGLQWLDCASRKGVPGLMISEEMSAASLATRMLNTITCHPQNTWQLENDRIRFDAKCHFEGRAPVLIEEKCSKISSAERAISRAVDSHGVKIVAVDYAQLIQGDGDSKEQRVSDVSSRLKVAATNHNIVVLLLAQLNRGIESRDNPHPQLADLRDSGGLEQDADVALFPFWPFKMDDSYEHQDEYRIYQRKNRNRGIGTAVIQMRINAPRQRLEPWTEPDEWDRSN